MNFDDFMNALAQKAGKEQAFCTSPRNAVLRRLDEIGAETSDDEQKPLFWTVVISGVAASLSVLISLDTYSLLTDPLGLFIGVLEYLPLEI